MNAVKPPHANGLEVIEHDDSTISILRDGRVVGFAFPAIIAEPDGPWFGRHRGQDAARFDTKDEAIAYVTGEAE